MLQFMEQVNKTSKATMADLFATYNFEAFNSNAGVRSDLFKRRLDQTLVTDFFGGVSHVEVGEPMEQVIDTSDVTPPPRTETLNSDQSNDVAGSNMTIPAVHDQPQHPEAPWQTLRTYMALLLILTLVGLTSRL